MGAIPIAHFFRLVSLAGFLLSLVPMRKEIGSSLQSEGEGKFLGSPASIDRQLLTMLSVPHHSFEPKRRNRFGTIAVSVAVHGLALTLLVGIPLATADIIAPPHDAAIIHFLPQPEPEPPSEAMAARAELPEPPKHRTHEPPQPSPEPPSHSASLVTEVDPPVVPAEEQPSDAPAPLNEQLTVGQLATVDPPPNLPLAASHPFDAASPTTVAAQLPSLEARTGVFGAAEGGELPVRSAGPGFATARTGAFDSEAAGAKGLPTGIASTTERAVSAVGFGSAPAPSAASGAVGPRRGGVKQTPFNATVSPAAPSRPVSAPAESPTEPVEILSKPSPVYTQEARTLRIEGEVVLEVLFGASGRLTVMRVVRGLGHGLDEAAVQAVAQMVFKPARRRGEPIDSRAMLRVLFQLA